MTKPNNKLNKNPREIELGEPWTPAEAQRILHALGYRYLCTETSSMALAALTTLMSEHLFLLAWRGRSVCLISTTRGWEFLVI